MPSLDFSTESVHFRMVAWQDYTFPGTGSFFEHLSELIATPAKRYMPAPLRISGNEKVLDWLMKISTECDIFILADEEDADRPIGLLVFYAHPQEPHSLYVGHLLPRHIWNNNDLIGRLINVALKTIQRNREILKIIAYAETADKNSIRMFQENDFVIDTTASNDGHYSFYKNI